MTFPWVVLLLLAHFAGWGDRWVDCSALALVAIGWGTALDRAVALAWTLGLMMDAASLGRLGPQAVAWSAAAAALSVEQRATHRRELPTLMLASGMVSAWLGVVTGCLGPPWPSVTLGAGLSRILLTALLTALAAPILLWPVRAGWMPRREGM